MRSGIALAFSTTVLVCAGLSAAQQPPAPAGRGNATAPPPILWPSPPLPDGPLQVDTGLVRPLKITRDEGTESTLVHGLPARRQHPGLPRAPGAAPDRCATARWTPPPWPERRRCRPPGWPVSWTCNSIRSSRTTNWCTSRITSLRRGVRTAPARRPAGRGPALPPGIITLARGRWDGSGLVEVKDIFSAVPSGNASRILFGRDGMLYMSVGYGDPPIGNPIPPACRRRTR